MVPIGKDKAIFPFLMANQREASYILTSLLQNFFVKNLKTVYVYMFMAQLTNITTCFPFSNIMFTPQAPIWCCCHAVLFYFTSTRSTSHFISATEGEKVFHVSHFVPLSVVNSLLVFNNTITFSTRWGRYLYLIELSDILVEGISSND